MSSPDLPPTDYAARCAAIQAHLARGGKVMTVTYTKATVYDQRHTALFSADARGLYVQRGKRKDCLNHTAVRFSVTTPPTERPTP